jgi:hypothetical protein
VDLQVFTMKIPPLSLMCEDGAFGLDQQRTERSSESVCSQPPQNVRTPNISELSPVYPNLPKFAANLPHFWIFWRGSSLDFTLACLYRRGATGGRKECA